MTFVGEPVTNWPNVRLNLAAVDFPGDVKWAEQVMSLWAREMKWHDLATEDEARRIARLAKDLEGYGADINRIHSQLAEQKKLRIDTEDELHRTSNAPGEWVNGLVGRVVKLRDNLAVIDDLIRVLQDDLNMIARLIDTNRKDTAAIEKNLRGRAFSRMSIKAQEYAERAWRDWLASCPVPDLLMPVVLNESMLADGVRGMMAWVAVRGEQHPEGMFAKTVPFTTPAGVVEVRDLNGISVVAPPPPPAPPVSEASVSALPNRLSGGLSRSTTTEADIEHMLGVTVE